MITLAYWQRQLRQIITPLFFLILIVYFIYHVFQGDRGVLAWFRLDTKISEARDQLKKLEATREGLENKVNLLSPKSLDLDMLEEQSRKILNFTREDELIVKDIPLPSPKGSAAP